MKPKFASLCSKAIVVLLVANKFAVASADVAKEDIRGEDIIDLRRNNHRRLFYNWKSLLYTTRLCRCEGCTWGAGWSCPHDPICDGPHPLPHCYHHYTYVDDNYISDGDDSLRYVNYNTDDNTDEYVDIDDDNNGSNRVYAGDDNYNDDESYVNQYVDQYDDVTYYDSSSASTRVGDPSENANSVTTSAERNFWPYILGSTVLGVVVASVLLKKRQATTKTNDGDLDDDGHVLKGSVARRMGLLADEAGDCFPVDDASQRGAGPAFLPIEASEQLPQNGDGIMTAESIEVELNTDNDFQAPYVAV